MQNRLKEVDVWFHQQLDQIRSVEIVVELLGVVGVAPRLNTCNDESFVGLERFCYQVGI
jgi:hypothetical protein